MCEFKLKINKILKKKKKKFKVSSRPILLEFGNNTLVYYKKRKTLLFLCGEDLLSPCEGSSTQPMPLFPGKKKKKNEMSPLKIVKQKVYVTDRRGLDIFNYF